jgi:hypothetical protein
MIEALITKANVRKVEWGRSILSKRRKAAPSRSRRSTQGADCRHSLRGTSRSAVRDRAGIREMEMNVCFVHAVPLMIEHQDQKPPRRFKQKLR